MYRKILKSPIITEKTSSLVENENKYTFEVDKSASKAQIKNALEKLYGVKVINVNVLKNRGRLKRSMVRRSKIYRSADIKKAIIELDPKDTLKLYEGGGK